MRHLRDRSQGSSRTEGGRAAGARAQHHPFQRGLVAAAHRAARRGFETRRRSSQRRLARRDAGRRRLHARRRRSRAGRRRARRRRGQGAARQGRPARRDAGVHRIDRPARHQSELGSDERLRHAVDGRLVVPLFGIPAQGGPGARRPDRSRGTHVEHPVSDGSRAAGRCGRDAARAPSLSEAQEGSLVAAEDRRRHPRVAAGS